MYNVQKVLSLESSPLMRLEKRLNSLRNTHETALLRNATMEIKNANVNRILMDSLMLRLHSVDSKSKKNKRIASRGKLSSPKKVRLSKSQDIFGSKCAPHPTCPPKFHAMKQADIHLLKTMRGTPSFDRSDIETIIAKDAYGMRNELPKVEPVFPPPPDSAAAAAVPAPVSIYPQESACPGLSSNLIPRSGLKMQKQASSPIHTASNSGRLGKFSPNCALPRQLATYQPPLCQPNRQVSPSQVPHNAYPYQDFRNKYEQGCYSNSQVGYDPFTPQHFCTGYQDFSQYPRSTDQPDWNSLCKYGSVSGDSNRTVPNMNASASEADCNFRVYPNVNPLRPELSTPFNTSPFMQDAPTYSMSIGSHNTTYGISQHNYTYPQVPLTTTPVVTTSYVQPS
uniref:Uncharacterized protein n=1 Tax=Schistocephalus solidus TaxID=70667 RepID=A0A0X3NJC9_SCHSO